MQEQARASLVVQTLIFPKSKFKDRASAAKWAKDHGFRADKADETPSSWRLRQRDPGDFRRGSFRTFRVGGAVQAVGGKVKEAKMATENVVRAALMGQIPVAAAAGLIAAVGEAVVQEQDEAPLPLRDGESVDDLLQMVRRSVSDAYSGGAYAEAIYGDYMIICFWSSDSPRHGEMIRLGWRREQTTGEVQLDLASEVQVRRITTYVPIGEAVEAPTAAQRRDLPDSAYAVVKEVDGRRERWFPHHVSAVREAAESSTVDVPRLRRAFESVGSAKGLTASERRRAREHLEAHAREVLKADAEQDEADRVEALFADAEDRRRAAADEDGLAKVDAEFLAQVQDELYRAYELRDDYDGEGTTAGDVAPNPTGRRRMRRRSMPQPAVG